MMASFKFALTLALGAASTHLLADNRGSINSGGQFSDSATICLSVGLTASLTQLDNFSLSPIGLDGRAGTQYTGKDNFHLESNGQVAIVIQGDELLLHGIASGHPSHRVDVNYNINGDSNPFVTEGEGAHSGDHQLNAMSILGAISAQRAGDYSGEVTLVVTPAIGGLAGCGQSTRSYPSQSSWGTIAFEDLYPNSGDADYNDFVVNFTIQENYNAKDELEEISMAFVPVARGAGYNHSFHLSLDGLLDKSRNVETQTTGVFGGDAEISVTYTNINNGQSHSRYFKPGQDLTIFSSTRVAAGSGFFNVHEGQDGEIPDWMTTVNISLNPDSEVMTSGLMGGEFNYRPYLHVNNTNNDIDLFQVNPNDNMIDANGYPFGIMVPDDWAWPTERTRIDNVYPYFSEYRAWLSGETEVLSDMASRWYDYPAAGSGDNLIDVNLDDLKK